MYNVLMNAINGRMKMIMNRKSETETYNYVKLQYKIKTSNSFSERKMLYQV